MYRASVTGDEVAHLPAGYTYVKTGDFRLNMQHPPLIKILAGIPLLGLQLKPVAGSPGWSGAQEGVFGRDFLVNNRRPLREIVFLGRLPMVGIGLLMGAVLFLWASELWGYWPGVFVLFLYAFSPNVLAHMPLVHTDVGVSCFTVLTLHALWKYSRGAELRYALVCGTCLGLALLAKYSGAVTALLVLVLFGAILLEGRRAGVSGCQYTPAKTPQLGAVMISLPLVTVLAALLVTFGFGFPYGLANYYQGFTLIHADANPHWAGFLWGQYSKDGFWYYYVLAQLWKTPLPALLFFLVALFVARKDEKTSRLDWWFILLPILAFHAAGMWQRASIGVRHVLPVFPFVFLACGATASWVGSRRAAYKVVFAGLCTWYLLSTVRMYPHFIPYFNELAGGPDNGIFYLDDSNIEWGQDYYGIKEYLDRHQVAEARLLAFEPIAREHYGIQADPILLRDAVWPQPDVTYFAGASYLQRNSLFNDRPGVRFHWLERYQPVDKIGWSIFVYRFSTDPADEGRAGVFYIPREKWYADAEESLREILSRSAGFDYAERILSDVHFDRANWVFERGERERALLDYVAAVRLTPLDLRYRAGFRKAVISLAETVPVDPAVPASQYYEQAFPHGGGEEGTGKSILALLKCQRKDPNHLGASFNLGQLYARLGFLDLAESAWKRSLAIRPGYVPALRSLEHAERLKAHRRAQSTGDE